MSEVPIVITILVLTLGWVVLNIIIVCWIASIEKRVRNLDGKGLWSRDIGRRHG